MPNPSVCAVVVTYNAGEFLSRVVDAVLPQVDRLLIVDNGSGKETLDILLGLEDRNPGNLSVLRNDANIGLAAALNQGVRQALEEGFRFLLTLDHDSLASPGMVAAQVEVFERHASENPGIVAPAHVDRDSGRIYRYVTFGKILFRLRTPDDEPFSCSYCITSGSLVRREVFEKAGLFREDYFLYAVDNEFCRRVRKNGYSILVSGRAVLLHREGTSREVHLPGGLSFDAPEWGPAGLYYIFRNMVFDLRARQSFSSRLFGFLFLLKTALSILLRGGPHRGERGRAAFRGARDGIRGRLGRSDRYS